MILTVFWTYLPYLLSLGLGYGIIHLLLPAKQRVPLSLKLILSLGLGLAVSGHGTFLSFILFNQLNRAFVIGLHILLLTVFFVMGLRRRRPTPFAEHPAPTSSQEIAESPLPAAPRCWMSVLKGILVLLSVLPLWYQSHFYVYGGWDAWSTWNLKAKFLFLGGEHWNNLFSPLLWRSSPHYPLLLPLINVWSWIFLNRPSFDGPIFTSFLFTLLSLGLLYSGLKDLTRSRFAFLPALALLTLPLFNKLSLSQYCDHVLGFYLLASLFCLIKAKNDGCPSYALLAGLFTGFLSFTKSEGLMASLILLFLAGPFFVWKNKILSDATGPQKKQRILKIAGYFLGGTLVGSLPTIVFNGLYAPSNITFVNGLASTENPATLLRLKMILGFYFFEMGTPLWNAFLFFKSWTTGLTPQYVEHKWHGLWLAAAAGLILGGRKCLHPRLILIPGFLLGYGLIITFYYWVNTYFEIGWWLQVSLHRILFAVLPTLLFWVFYTLWQD